MKEPNCPNCPMRARYDKNPRSLTGRFWKWHISWCPGWKAYLRWLPEKEREAVFQKYGRRAV